MKKTILRNRSSPTKSNFGSPQQIGDQCTNSSKRADFENTDVSFNDSGCYGSPESLAHWDVCTCRRGSSSKNLRPWETLPSPDSSSKKLRLWETLPSPGSSSKKLRLWETLPSPAKYLRNKWKGRASFVEDESMPWIKKLGPQHILKGLVILVIIASFGFTFLTYSRHMRGADSPRLNEKYKSIEFGVVKRSIELEEKGKLIKDIVDEEGNVLGGKKAAIQFGHDLKMKPEKQEDGLDSLLELEAQLSAIRAMLKGEQGSDNEDLELEYDFNEELFKETFRFAADDSDSSLVNKKKRDVKDGAFRFGSETVDLELANDQKRDIKEDSFRLASDNVELELSSFNN